MTTEYYRELTRRNTGLISADTQLRLRRTTVLVAGCGSTGGAVIEPLARIGVGGMTLVEPGTYELNNLNRQDAYIEDIGRNKAQTAATRVGRINPECQVSVHVDGITAANADRIVRDSTIVVDGVDVTTRSGWHAKLAVHQAAARHRLTVVSGWDLASSQYVRIYRYGVDRTLAPLGGLTPDDGDTLSVWSLIKRLVPSSAFPSALVDDIVDRGAREPEYSVPQLVQAALTFGAIVTQLVLNDANGISGPAEILVDLQYLTTGVPNTIASRAEQWFKSLP